LLVFVAAKVLPVIYANSRVGSFGVPVLFVKQ
jgi:hypothetical protein